MKEWLSMNIIEVFGAVAGLAYVILEIKRNILLWPVGIVTSGVYIYVFASNGFYANMVLQWYYLFISIYGWYQWHRARGMGHGAGGMRGVSDESREAGKHGAKSEERGAWSEEQEAGSAVQGDGTDIRHLDPITAIASGIAALLLWAVLWYVLDRWTDSTVPAWDGLIASLSVVATWMLTRKILEQWYVWIVANTIAVIVYLGVGLYPTAGLFVVYTVMAVVGARAWRNAELRVKS